MFARSIALVVFTVGVAHAQTLSPQEDRIQSALAELRGRNSVFLHLEGRETIGTAPEVLLDSRAFWFTDSTVQPTVLKLDLKQYRDGTLHSRAVGDGKTLWHYNNRAFRYSANLYGRWSTNEYANYRRDLIELMTEGASGETAMLARLISQTFSGDAPLYSRWLPGVVPQDDTDDPNDVVYSYGDPLARQVVFDLSPMDSGGYRLEGIEYLDRKPVAGKARETQFRITVLPAEQASADMSFVPEPLTTIENWKKVTRPKPGIQ